MVWAYPELRLELQNQMTVSDPQIIVFLKAIAPYVTGGLGGAIFTLLTRMWTDRSRRKIVKFSIGKQRFSLPDNISQGFIDSDSLTVSYKNEGYSHLALYSVTVENIGYGSVEGQKVVFIFPEKTTVIEEVCSCSVPTVTYKVEDYSTEAKITKDYTFTRIENSDSVTISFLVDCEFLDEIKCLPRGTDNVDYLIGDNRPKSEIEQSVRKLLLYLVMFVIVGGFDIIPPLDDAVRALILFVSIPDVTGLINSAFLRKASSSENNSVSVVIHNEGNNSIVTWGLRSVSVNTEKLLNDKN
ncbi:hypothetical protein NIES4103_59510 [Nostoc sp. NIES-4103]|nr:hypothetical protein NIES4103_59510 [Nostoc sp. NIES-4103]